MELQTGNDNNVFLKVKGVANARIIVEKDGKMFKNRHVVIDVLSKYLC